jgi:hypothetical protein
MSRNTFQFASEGAGAGAHRSQNRYVSSLGAEAQT